MIFIKGGITAPKGFLAGAVSCGIKKSGRNDLALLFSKVPCVCAGTFTTNRCRSSSVILSEARTRKGVAQAILVNSGNANCCVGKKGLEDAKKITALVAEELDLKEDSVLIASTGIIGRPLPVNKILTKIALLIKDLDDKNASKFAKTIMTTDTVAKEIAVEIEIGNSPVRIAGVAKGAGMIYPKMATMLAFFTTDANIENIALVSAFKDAIDDSFNRISVDGDMSTNDTALVIANGMAKNRTIKKSSSDFLKFLEAVKLVAEGLAKKIVLDGEGATKFIAIIVKGASSFSLADKVARRVANSNLVKTMIAGGDPNWGRIAAAIGSSSVDINAKKLDIYFGNTRVMKNGSATNVSRKKLLKIFKEKKIDILANLNTGNKTSRIWSCDLTEEYVRINAEYET